jgi:hypothetical protein
LEGVKYEKTVFDIGRVFPYRGGGGELAFAQEVKVGKGTLSLGAKIMTGMEATWDDAANEDGTVRMYNDTEGTRLRVEFSPAYSNENVGFMMRFRTDDAWTNGKLGGGGNSAAVGVRYAFGWIDLFDSHFRATGGYLDINSNVWGTMGDLDKDISGVGLRLEIKPVKGLNFGAFFRVPDQKRTVTLAAGGHSENDSQKVDFDQFFASTAFGGRYTNDLFYVSLQYLLDQNVFDNDKSDGSGRKENKYKNGIFDFGVGLTAIPQLELRAEGRFENLENDKYKDAAENWTNYAKTDLRQRVIYTISDDMPLFFGVNAKETFTGLDDDKPYMIFKPKVGYKVPVGNGLVASLEGGFGFQTDILKSEIFVKPKIEYDFGKGFGVKFWYLINAKEWETGKSGGKKDDKLTANTLQLEITWQL